MKPQSSLLIEACLNGGRESTQTLHVPCTPGELAADARSCVEAGARAIHIHPRNQDGVQTLSPEPCAEAILAVRRACPHIPIGLTTGAWIEPNVSRRLSLLDAWDVLPHFVSVNFEEEGSKSICKLLLEKGVGIEAGLSTPADADVFLQSGLCNYCIRVLVEPMEYDILKALEIVSAIDNALNHANNLLPRLYHGKDMATWIIIEKAIQKGNDVRIGLEDTFLLPDGAQTSGNAELVRSAVRLAEKATSAI